MAFKIVENRQEARIDKVAEDRDAAAGSAAKKEKKARRTAGLNSKGDTMAAMGLDHRRNRTCSASFGSAMKGESGVTEQVEEEEEEDDEVSLLSSTTGSTAATARGAAKRAALEDEQARNQARLEEEENKKRQKDPLWAVVGMMKEQEGAGAGGKDREEVLKTFVEIAQKKEEREERVGKQQQEKADLETVMTIQKFMTDNKLTVDQLPPKMKRTWDKLNADSDEE